jgi:hypothetical protein
VELELVNELEELFNAATFRLCLGVPPWKAHANSNDWGTGVFFTKDLALTADHNVRDGSGRTRFTARYNGHDIELEWIQEWSCEELDIALLRLVKKPPALEIETLPVGYLDPDMKLDDRKLVWAGRHMIIFGWRYRGDGQESCTIDAKVDPNEPIIEKDRKTRSGHGDRVESEVEWLRVILSPVREIEGISGAGILDSEFRTVVAIEHAYFPDEGRVVGTEIGLFVKKFPMLKQYFQPLRADPARYFGWLRDQTQSNRAA